MSGNIERGPQALLGLDDDFAALRNARYIALGARSFTAQEAVVYIADGSNVRRFQGFAASLMVNSDDVVALRSAVYTPPGSKIV
jgi:hypothetical protein